MAQQQQRNWYREEGGGANGAHLDGNARSGNAVSGSTIPQKHKLGMDAGGGGGGGGGNKARHEEDGRRRLTHQRLARGRAGAVRHRRRHCPARRHPTQTPRARCPMARRLCFGALSSTAGTHALRFRHAPPHPTLLHPYAPSPFASTSAAAAYTMLLPSYAPHAAAPAPSQTLLARYPSTIMPTSEYLRAPTNGYAHAGAPKRFVHLVGPHGRRRAREDEQHRKRDREQEEETNTHFGISATKALRQGEEIDVGWEWDDGNAVHRVGEVAENRGAPIAPMPTQRNNPPRRYPHPPPQRATPPARRRQRSRSLNVSGARAPPPSSEAPPPEPRARWAPSSASRGESVPSSV
ncbi:hypothetical protein C8R44DRAFT_250173 [Mycena epipterygia]|nr:hypothetical protein C8R44DRAFT_250173 [Mycena epipterygia]